MGTGEPHTKLPRLQRKPTNWNICVICQRTSYHKNRTLHKIQTENLANSLKETAHERNDEEMLTRIETVDLIAVNAVYHKNCQSTYESSRSIRAARKHATDQEVNEHYDQAFQQLIADVHVGLMFKRQIFTLTQLLQCLKSKFPIISEDVSALRADKLQKKLIEHYGKDEVILTQQGQSKSSFVLWSDISVLEALKTTTQLKSNLKSKQMEDDFQLDTDTGGEEIRILHQAAGIIHKALDESPRLKKIWLSYSRKCQPQSIKRLCARSVWLFIQWVLDKASYLSGKLMTYSHSPLVSVLFIPSCVLCIILIISFYCLRRLHN